MQRCSVQSNRSTRFVRSMSRVHLLMHRSLMHINSTRDSDSNKQCHMSGNSLTPAVLPYACSRIPAATEVLAFTIVSRNGGLLLGPYCSEAKGEVGDHGTDEATPVETQLPS